MIQETNWYVIQVSTGSEYNIRDMIMNELERTRTNYEDCFVPLIEFARKIKGKYEIKIKPMFPGYIFLITEYIENVNEVLKNVAKFTKILGDGNIFLPLYKNEVDFLMEFNENHHSMSMSYGVIENDIVVIYEGPLIGKEGLIKKIDRHKRTALLEINFLGKNTKMIVPLEIVSKK